MDGENFLKRNSSIIFSPNIKAVKSTTSCVSKYHTHYSIISIHFYIYTTNQ